MSQHGKATTVKKKAKAVEETEANWRRQDLAAQADAGEGIRQGLEDAKNGRIRPARQFFEEFELSMKHHIHRPGNSSGVN